MKSNYPKGKWELIENPIALESRIAVVSKEEGEKDILICQITSIRGDSYEDNTPYIPSISKLIVESGNVLIETGKTPLQLADENKNLLEALKDIVDWHHRVIITNGGQPHLNKAMRAIKKTTEHNEKY